MAKQNQTQISDVGGIFVNDFNFSIIFQLEQFFQPATQMDLFTTFVRLANENIPQDRIIDGNDLRSDLGITKPDLVQDQTLGRSVYYYRGNLLMAIRHGLYKMHLWTWTTPEDELVKVSIFTVWRFQNFSAL